MAGRRHDPLHGITTLVVDGSNLLHAMRPAGGPGSDRSGPAVQPATLIGRLRAVIPAPIAVELVLDGPPDPGLGGRRLASGVTVRHAGRRSADAVIAERVAQAPRSDTGQIGLLVVSDDREVASDARRGGATVMPTRWLIDRLSRTRLSAPSIGRPRPPGSPSAPSAAGDPDAAEDRPWQTGRGATRKRGNPRRRPKGGPATMRP